MTQAWKIMACWSAFYGIVYRLNSARYTQVIDSEILKNQRAVEHAIAQQRLEGLAVPPEAARDLQRIALGEITPAEALLAAHARFAHDQVFQ